MLVFELLLLRGEGLIGGDVGAGREGGDAQLDSAGLGLTALAGGARRHGADQRH
ncbi:hypothetical protein [Microbacterium sp. NIBRBAC000506063]|uniref:hypothetical protein n=1 Tax=Microbacterium sp. NIBRBAC000506063 TaxID=2734618 RepID=UPI001CB71042|nr:hypothetical protein [Microbacterium sp. NIBRBAC000506063]